MAAIVASKMKRERQLRESRSFPDEKFRRRSSPPNISNLHEDETFKSCQSQVVEEKKKYFVRFLKIKAVEIL